MVDAQPTLPLASHLAALRQSFRRVERLVERLVGSRSWRFVGRLVEPLVVAVVSS